MVERVLPSTFKAVKTIRLVSDMQSSVRHAVAIVRLLGESQAKDPNWKKSTSRLEYMTEL